MNTRFQAGEKVAYVTAEGRQGKPVTLERLCPGDDRMEVHATSGSFGDMGPFLMRFDAETGEGLGDYEGTKIEKL